MRFTPAGLGTSAYKTDSTYHATLTTVAQSSETELWIGFDARGEADLREPASSCLIVTGSGGQSVLHAYGENLSVADPDHYVGSLQFPLIVSGDYQFRYSCADDYTDVPIGIATVPHVGVSVYDDTYFAVVLAAAATDAGLVVTFAATGNSDLRDPGTSCLKIGDDTVQPAVQLTMSVTDHAAFYTGTLTFSGAAAGQFVYSCGDDYSAVDVP